MAAFQNCDSFKPVNIAAAPEDLDPGAPSDVEPDAPPAPIVADALKWTFVPIEGAKCADGSATGIGVNPSPESDDLFIYVQGGGACTTPENCWGTGPGGAVNLDGFDAEDFAAEDFKDQYPLFERTAGTENPFASMNMIMMPYCTGDAHSGNVVRDFEFPMGSGQIIKTHFVGAKNFELALARIAVSFPEVKNVWLLGTSAGGAGANYNFSKVRTALKLRVNLINDSAPGFSDPGEEEKWETWGIVKVCETCETVGDTRRFNRTLDPESRFAFMSFAFDATAANGRSPKVFASEMQDLVAEVQTDANARTFIADNSATRFSTTLHVVSTKREEPVKSAVAEFLSAMVKGSEWENTRLALSNP